MQLADYDFIHKKEHYRPEISLEHRPTEWPDTTLHFCL